ncbi:hypothetical protein MED297_15315 [Reinekea sp. MED297]|uniref:Uncharacterized protein n=1 Tax=Reinekea blandensis MED297 TaxID=314283 RepID=A4BIX8_9GAMM|nr:hypothetical protein MED297_15315 [Reinekea sp. MED297] [Reinekea blandensis MED297]
MVWVGAGKASTPKNVEQFDRAFLIEGRLSQAEHLRDRFKDNPKVQVLAKVVNAQASEQSFYQLNIAEYSALHEPGELYELYPGIKVESAESQQSTSIDDLLSDIHEAIGESQSTLLLDTPDIAFALVQKLIETQWLDKLATVTVAVTPNSLYKGNEGGDIDGLLALAGWIPKQTDRDDPEWQYISYEPNPLAGQVKELKQALKKEFEEKETAQQSLQRLEAQLEEKSQSNAKLAKQEAELKHQLAQLQEKVKQQPAAEELEKLKQTQQAIAKERESLKAQIADVQASEKRAKEEKAAFEKHYVNHQQRMADLEKENRQLRDENEQTQKRQELLDAELKKAEAQIEIIKELLLKESSESDD